MSNSKKKALSISSGVVIPEWIDINGHMNVAYYVRAFDMAVDEQWAGLGITAEYITNNKASTLSDQLSLLCQIGIMSIKLVHFCIVRFITANRWMQIFCTKNVKSAEVDKFIKI